MPARLADRKVTKASDAGTIAAYKTILRDCIDRRPAGLRARIASALGKHKSFVSQLTNPIYPMPVPARHVETIFEICHFSPEERRSFLKAYARAHPEKTPEAVLESGSPPRRKTISLEIPELGDPRKQRELESLLRELAERLRGLFD
jgi:hypothetical protein